MDHNRWSDTPKAPARLARPVPDRPTTTDGMPAWAALVLVGVALFVVLAVLGVA